MSLARLALRLQAIETIKADPFLAAALGGRVFDSKLGDFNAEDPVPVVVVSTEATEGPAWAENNGGPPFALMCSLVCEIGSAIIQRDEDGAPVAIFRPETERELEALLDAIGDRIEQAIGDGQTAAARLLRRAVTKRVVSTKTDRYGTAETGEKLGVHLLTLKVELKEQTELAPLEAPSGPFGTLPEPLRTVCAALPAGSSSAAICTSIAAQFAPPVDAKLAHVNIRLRMPVDPGPEDVNAPKAEAEIVPADLGWTDGEVS